MIKARLSCLERLSLLDFKSDRRKRRRMLEQYLAIYELDDPRLAFATPEWDSVVGWDEHVEFIRGFHGFHVYELLFEQTAGASS